MAHPPSLKARFDIDTVARDLDVTTKRVKRLSELLGLELSRAPNGSVLYTVLDTARLRHLLNRMSAGQEPHPPKPDPVSEEP